MTDTQKSSGFDEFWQAYPRRIAKGAARRAYDKATKQVEHQTIMAGLERYKAHLDTQKAEKRFICHASTWLNQERWADEYEGQDTDWQPSTQKRLRWEERYRLDPRLVPAAIRRMYNIGEYAK